MAIITGGLQGIGAGLVAGYRERGWAVAASARTFKPSGEPAARMAAPPVLAVNSGIMVIFKQSVLLIPGHPAHA